MVPITAIILTYNEEKNIESCLKSIVDWCPEIFIVDSGSTHGTKEICSQYPLSIYEHQFVDHPDQWNRALNNLPSTGEWILPLDADYVISEELRRDLTQAVLKQEPGVNGYYARHQYYFMGAPMRGFKSHTLCLFRHKKTGVDYGELVDHRFLVEGRTRMLRGTLHEINRNEWDIDNWTDKHQKYSTRMALQEVLTRAGMINRSLSANLMGNLDERITYLIVGDGRDRRRLEEKARSLGVGDRVVFAGFIPESEKTEHYRLADAYVMPGWGEGFGFVYLEALACGIPALGSKLDGSREALRDGDLGILVDPHDRDDLWQGLLEVLIRPRGSFPRDGSTFP